MGVDRTDYVIIGYKLPYNFNNVISGERINWHDDTFLPYIEGRKGCEFGIIIDQMCGDYAVFGKVLARAYEDTGFEFKEITYDDMDFDKVKEKFVELFGGYTVMDMLDREFQYDPKLFVFSNFN